MGAMASREGFKPGKWVHHRCGYRLWVEVLHRFSGEYEDVAPVPGLGASVVVTYRDSGVVVSMCPRCYGALRLWWSVDDGNDGQEV